MAATWSAMMLDGVQVGSIPAMPCRNRSRTRWPCSVCMTSGWNCTPARRPEASSKAATGARGLDAVTTKPSGATVTQSPWLIHTVCSAGNPASSCPPASRQIASGGVEVTIVFASHANNVPLSLLSEAQRANLGPDGTSIVIGAPTGYVIKFTNGLTAYLSGDTGIHTEMKTVVNEYHKANLAVLNLGPSAGTAMSGAHAMNELVKPAAVILSHPNEAVTEGGKLRPASRAAALIKQLKGVTPHLAISGRTMEFDGSARCVAGCQ